MLGFLRRKLAAPAIPDADWAALRARLRLLDARTDDEVAALRALTAEFLARKTFSPARGLVLDSAMCLSIAAQACLPVLNLGFDWLRGWREVIVYPGQFRVRRRDHDEESNVVHEWDDELAGEAWSHGPIVLSWADIEQDLADPFEGFNVVIHEIAHKLDLLDGDSDGTPPLRGARHRDWVRTMQAAYDEHARAVDRGEDTVLDPYAAEAPDEFFAVASEYYFTAADVLAEHYPAVHAELAKFYG
jgi:Mlc titration factor MtfA (ptsG expression regulator)